MMEGMVTKEVRPLMYYALLLFNSNHLVLLIYQVQCVKSLMLRNDNLQWVEE